MTYLVPIVFGALLGAIGLGGAVLSNRYGHRGSWEELAVMAVLGAALGGVGGYRFARKAEAGEVD